MKKSFDIEKAEAWAEKGFSGIEKNIEFTGVPHKAADTGKNTAYKERNGVLSSPLLQIAGVFIVAAVVIGLTFGTLKYLEKAANQHNPAGADTIGISTEKAPNKVAGTETEQSVTDTAASATNETDTEPDENTENTYTPITVLFNVNDVYVMKGGADGHIWLNFGIEPLGGLVVDGAEKWNGMILLTKDGKQFLYKTEFYGTADNRRRYGFLFPDLPDGFDSILQISEGVYLILDNGKWFPATLYQNKLYKDVDCTAVKAVADDRVVITSAEMKTGLYYVGYGVFEELYPQTADEIVYSAESTYTADGDRFDLFFAKENGYYAVFVTETDVYGSAYVTRASDFVYTNVKADENNVMTAQRGGKTYYISPYDGSESEEAPKDHRVIQTIGGYKVIRYYRNLGCGVVDSDGNTVIPFEYWMINAVSEDRFFCSKIKGEDGVILDNNGNLIADGFRFVYPITPDFEFGNHFVNLYLAERNGDAVWIDKDGNVLGFE